MWILLKLTILISLFSFRDATYDPFPRYITPTDNKTGWNIVATRSCSESSSNVNIKEENGKKSINGSASSKSDAEAYGEGAKCSSAGNAGASIGGDVQIGANSGAHAESRDGGYSAGHSSSHAEFNQDGNGDVIVKAKDKAGAQNTGDGYAGGNANSNVQYTGKDGSQHVTKNSAKGEGGVKDGNEATGQATLDYEQFYGYRDYDKLKPNSLPVNDGGELKRLPKDGTKLPINYDLYGSNNGGTKGSAGAGTRSINGPCGSGADADAKANTGATAKSGNGSDGNANAYGSGYGHGSGNGKSPCGSGADADAEANAGANVKTRNGSEADADANAKADAHAGGNTSPCGSKSDANVIASIDADNSDGKTGAKAETKGSTEVHTESNEHNSSPGSPPSKPPCDGGGKCPTIVGSYCRYNVGGVQKPQQYYLGPEKINVDICDYIAIEYAFLDEDKLVIQPTNGNNDIELYKKVGALQKTSFIVLGSYVDSGKSEKYFKLFKSDEATQNFIKETIKSLKEWSLSGLEICFIWPGAVQADPNKGGPNDKQIFLNFVKKVYQAFKQAGLFLIVDIPWQPELIDKGFDLVTMQSYVDAYIMLSYDFSGSWMGTAGITQNLKPTSCESDNRAIDTSVQYALKVGVKPCKLLITIATVARTFTLKDGKQKCIGAPISKGGPPGPELNAEGILNYAEACEAAKKNWAKCNVVTSYVDVKDATEIALYTRNKELAGICVMAIDADDPNNLCNCASFPLTRTVHEILHGAPGSSIGRDCISSDELHKLPLQCCNN